MESANFSNFEASYSYQKSYIVGVFRDISNRTQMNVISELKSLIACVNHLGFPFVLLLNKSEYVNILIDLYFENQSYCNLIRELIIFSINKMDFELRISRVNSSIDQLVNFADSFLNETQPNLPSFRELTHIESTYIEYTSLLNDCVNIKFYLENEKSISIEEDNVKQILMRISKLLNIKLKMLPIDSPTYISDFFQECADNLLEYDNFFCQRMKADSPRRNAPVVIKTDPKNRTSFYHNEVLHDEESLLIEYKNYNLPFSANIIETLKKQICGFLNADGGRLYIGITDDKVVKGIKLTAKQRDTLRNQIANFTVDFYPNCRTNKIEVVLVPVKSRDEMYINNLWVVKVIVRQGEVDKLYSVESRGFLPYMRMPGQCVLMSAMEICEEIVKRKTTPRAKVDEKVFQDPPAEVPLSLEGDAMQVDGDMNIHQKSEWIKIDKNNKNNKNNINVQMPYTKKVKVELPPGKNFNNLNHIQNNLTSFKDRSSSKDQSEGFTLSVQGIPTSVKEEVVLKIFNPTKYSSSRVFVDDNKNCKGWAYFNYNSQKEVADALNRTKNANINGAKLQVRLK